MYSLLARGVVARGRGVLGSRVCGPVNSGRLHGRHYSIGGLYERCGGLPFRSRRARGVLVGGVVNDAGRGFCVATPF